MRVFAVTNMYPTTKDPTLGTFVEQQVTGLRQIGVDVQVMYVDRAQKGIKVYFGLGNEARQRLKQWQPHVVHVMYGGIMAYMITRAISDTPVVVSFCGTDLLGEHLSGKVRKVISKYSVKASHIAARRASRIIVKSTNLLNALPSYIDYSKVRIIPNGVDLERFKPLAKDYCQNRLGWKPSHFHVLFPFNQGDLRKRPALAQSAIDVLKSWNIEAQFHRLHGIPHNEVPIYLNASDVLLLTSLHEGSPNIVKEALACNVPIVSVDAGDVRERLDGITGCYLAAPTCDDLAAKLLAIYKGPRKVNGRDRIGSLSLLHVARVIKELYEGLLVSSEEELAKSEYRRHVFLRNEVEEEQALNSKGFD